MAGQYGQHAPNPGYDAGQAQRQQHFIDKCAGEDKGLLSRAADTAARLVPAPALLEREAARTPHLTTATIMAEAAVGSGRGAYAG
ncbi:hypothetical protein GGTG_13411 [Gaeumannomyces tritici R3-111a-1]|uniref:Uncharacterized protein n=1 Tax=Gaeumannomyces tritici (strain R3-111a-1) TaxID=644352 RepID=J3PIT1_GAET3|nr:hypothetical protein GGTG_13411 [Gaeumannomyces tritici R3-111a-1]EJT69014.1 hypothetical protein GGTG_13411 [Gaeumannomyces tritici R3-111a-1]